MIKNLKLIGTYVRSRLKMIFLTFIVGFSFNNLIDSQSDENGEEQTLIVEPLEKLCVIWLTEELTTNLFAIMSPVALISPTTCSLWPGVVVPMPTLPEESIVNLWAAAVASYT